MQTNQSTANAASYKSSDLQVAKSSGTATKSFTMAHSMGLVRITLGTKQVNTTYTDYVNNEASDGITNSTKITITASNAFTGNIPYSHTDGKYYFVGQKATKPSFATSTAGIRKWNSMTPASNLSNCVYADLTASVAWASNYYYKAYAYSYRAAQQTFAAQANTTYKIECWGAQGADHYRAAESYHAATTHYGGRGGYVKGYISFTSSRTLYLYTGDQAGYNGGGVISDGQSGLGANGGGSTDVRLSAATSSGWSGTASFRSRIIVAAGGGGANNRWSDSGAAGTWWGEGDGGYGGGLNGGNGQSINHDKGSYYDCYGASQIAGGTIIGHGMYGGETDWASYYGQFGYARVGVGGTLHIQSAAGGGWYGGAGKYHSGGSGGSSFMTGFTGCNGINSSTGAHTNSANSIIDGYTYAFTGFSGCYHTDSMVLAAGNQTIPSPTGSLTGSGTETGHTGTGYIIITVCPLED